MNHAEISSELEYRIQQDIDHFGGRLSEPFSIAWRAYLAAFLEWGIIDVGVYDQLTAMLPTLQEDPSTAILRRRA
jgi:hypothetical protein